MYLRYNIQENPKERRQWLPMAEFWYNTSHHSAIDCSPFTALYGHDPNLGAMPITPGSIEALEPGMLANREAHQELLKKHLADKNRTEKEFHVGDKVLLKLQPYVQKSVIKEYRANYSPVFADLPDIPALDATDTIPERVLDRRMVKKGNATIVQVLVKWTNVDEASASWENWDVLKERFPFVVAWGQANFPAGGIDTHQVMP
ncbi:uncharacterized protein [Lolium perenne]|uniref:uncharacterized protein n=1 Tax=Lolium perenne TaxID=4522 RepID=UPI003A99C507